VDDLDTVDQWFDDVFCALHVKRSSEPLAMRDATFVVIGDLLMEAMKVADIPGAERSPLGRFHARVGEHLHSIAMFVESVDDTADTLAAKNIRLLDIAGRPIGPERPVPTPWMWTHPKDTKATYEFAEMPRFHYDPRFHPSWRGEFWREHPLGIEFTSHISVVVRSLDDAQRIYADAYGGTLLHTSTDAAGGGRHAYYTLGPDIVIEAVEPRGNRSLEARELERCGEGIFGVTFKVRDLESAAAHLQHNEQVLIEHSSDTIVLDPAHTFGMAIGFTTRALPNERRRVGEGVRR